MSKPTRVIRANADEVPVEIVDLTVAISKLPPAEREKIDPPLTRVIDSTKRRRRILSLVQDALGQLRLDMKYLAFDLEATRRERDEFRRKLEESS
ncbi:MAG: transcriptional regulator [Planctomycetes bacterium RBG_13_63_9]|nr:MAG: transcriptional regulator [Planctomycetes bacterium RBG_13_63_9]